MSDNNSSFNLNELFDKLFEDKNNNGIPDSFEHSEGGMNFSFKSKNEIVINGKKYSNIDEVPLEEKEKIKDAFKNFKEFKSGSSIISNFTTDFSTPPTPKTKESNIPLLTNEEPSKKISNAKIINIILLIALAVAVWFIWSRQ